MSKAIELRCTVTVCQKWFKILQKIRKVSSTVYTEVISNSANKHLNADAANIIDNNCSNKTNGEISNIFKAILFKLKKIVAKNKVTMFELVKRYNYINSSKILHLCENSKTTLFETINKLKTSQLFSLLRLHIYRKPP